MIGPKKAQCGIADYTDYLTTELRKLVEVSLLTADDVNSFEMNAADLIHVQHQYFLFGGVAPWRNTFSRLVKQFSRPALLTAHEFVEPHGGPLRKCAIGITNRIQFDDPAIKKIIVHTNADRARMMQSGISEQRVAVIRHGVPPPPDLPDSARAKDSLNLAGKFVITVFGFLSRRKGHKQAIEAIANLPDSASLILAGGKHPDDTTTYVAELEDLIEERKLQDRVRITGYLQPESVAQVMSATDLVLAPFDTASGSGSLAMAFACGKPIVASDIGPHLEIVSDTPGAMAHYRASQGGDLAVVIESMMQKPRLREEFAAGARNYAETHSYREMARQTVALYKSVLGAAA